MVLLLVATTSAISRNMAARTQQAVVRTARRFLSGTAASRPASMQPQQQQAKPANYLLLAVPVVTFGLGTWQVFRKKQKEELIATLEAKLSQDPVALAEDPETAFDMVYKRVKVEGEFLHDQEMQLYPRTPMREVFGGMSDIPEAGAQIVTPFRRADNDQIILINRGFVPDSLRDPRKRQEGQLAGVQTIEGIVRNGEKKTAFVPANTPEKNQWHWLDLFGMAQHAGASPILIDVAENGTPPGGFPLAGQTQISIRNEHMSYILTWYSLSAITLAMWFFLRRRKPNFPRRRLPPPLASAPA